jgi:ribosomal protein S18 acetylase RimI-like enzyme
MAGMRIVELGQGDDELLDRAVRTFRGVTGIDHATFLADPSSVCLVTIDGDDVVGWAWGTRQRHVCGYSQLQLYEVEVIEPSRRLGIGSRLVEAFLDIGRRDGDAKVYLFTGVANTAANMLYKHLGGKAFESDERGYFWELITDPRGQLDIPGNQSISDS